MTDPDPPTGDRPAAAGRWLWLLPAVTFLAGALLAGVVVGVGQVGAVSDPSAAPASSAAPDAEPGTADAGPEGEDVYVRVPRSCLEASESALALAEQADRLAAAVRDLDARRLRDLVDEVQQVRDDVRDSGEQCRSSAGQGVVDGTTTSPAPSPQASP